LFVGGGFIYTSTPTHLVRAPVGGGAVENVAPSSLTWAILADDANVYWSTPTQVLRMAHAGGAPDVVATTTGAEDIFLDATRLYWATGFALESVPIAGGEPMTVDVPTFEPGVALAAGRLFEPDCSSIELQAPGVIVAGYNVVANSSHCYIRHGTFCSPSSGCGDLVSIPIDGGATVVAQGETAGEATAFDGQRMMLDESGVYLRRADSSTGTLIRVPFDGDAVVDVTTDLALAYEVAADTIYWATLGDDGVRLKSMPKYKP
jgi:hypothetical protein